MLFMEDGIQFEAKMGDGSNPNQGLFDKLLSVGSRVLTGESLFMTHFTNRGHRSAKVGFSAPYPGTVIPIDLAQSPSNQLIVQKDGFLCAAFGTQISILLIESWVQVWLEGKDLSGKNCKAMAKLSFMPGALSLNAHSHESFV